MNPSEKQTFEKLAKRYDELNSLLAEPKVSRDRNLVQKYTKEARDIKEGVSLWGDYRSLQREAAELTQMIQDEGEDEDLKRLAEEEERSLGSRITKLEVRLGDYLTRRDSHLGGNALVEIRPGAGGEEAALFAKDLYQMYGRFAARKGWKVENMHVHYTPRGGIKEIIFAVEGLGVFETFQFESGVHRVQRVPETESSGRIHTSTVTMAVLPEHEEVEVDVRPEDLRIDTFHSRGAGGQHVNVTDSAVRITHVPTGLVAQCQDERSQHQNRIKAMRVLRAKLLQIKEAELEGEISEKRRAQIGRGERSERIRTYNFPEGRVTDHRYRITVHNLPAILNGEMDALLASVREQASRQKT